MWLTGSRLTVPLSIRNVLEQIACPGKLTLKILLWFLLNAYRFLIIVKWKNLKSNNFKWGPSVEVYLLCVHSDRLVASS